MKKSLWVKMQDAGIDPKFFDMVSQFAHYFTWYAICMTVGLVTRSTKYLIGSFVLCVVYAAVHEFYWDPRHEDSETRGSDLEDFAYLVAGGCIGSLVVWFFLLR